MKNLRWGRKSLDRTYPLRCGKGHAGSDPAQFEHAVANIAVLGQMGRSNSFAAAGHHLIERPAFSELGVELPAEFTRPGRACIEAMDYSGINVFHEKRLLGGLDCPVCEAESQYSASDDFISDLTDAFVLQGEKPDKPFVAGVNFVCIGII